MGTNFRTKNRACCRGDQRGCARTIIRRDILPHLWSGCRAPSNEQDFSQYMAHEFQNPAVGAACFLHSINWRVTVEKCFWLIEHLPVEWQSWSMICFTSTAVQ